MADASDGLLISRAAELSGLSLRALRYYDTAGIVVPSGRSRGGYRLYSAADVRRLCWVKPLQAMGLVSGDLIEALDLLEETRARPSGESDGATPPGHGPQDRRRQDYLQLARDRHEALQAEMTMLEDLMRDLGDQQPSSSPSASPAPPASIDLRAADDERPPTVPGSVRSAAG